jgi:hypothetical protein
MQGWTLALEDAASANAPLLVLRPTPELTNGLFKQIFSRAMESLRTPPESAIPIVLRGEFDGVVGGQLTAAAMLAAAREAGLADGALTPRCVVHRHVSEPGNVRQVYFVYFEAPRVRQFRGQLGLDADVLSPILFVAGAGADFVSWLPQRVNPDADCVAPIEVAE